LLGYDDRNKVMFNRQSISLMIF